MHLWSPKRTSSTTMLSMAERYKQAYDCTRDELRRVKVLHAKQLADKDAMIQDLNEQIHRLQQQQQHNPTRTLSKSSSSSLSISNKPARRNSFSVSTNSTSSLMKMAELASFSSSFSNSVDDEESVTSHNGGVIHESFLSMPTEPLREADEEAEEEEKEEQQQRQAKDIPSQPKKGETVRFKAGHNRPDEDDEEVASDKLPRRNHSLSIFVKRASKRFVRRISSKQKSARPFFRRQVRRKGTPVPTTMQIMADLKEKKVEGNNQDEDDPRDIHFNPDPDNEDEESRDKVPRLDSLQRKASIYSRSSSGWSIDAMPSDSPHRLQAAKSSSDWSTDPLPSDSAVGSTKPRRATIASTTVRVRALPRELSLDRVVSEEDSDDDDDWLSPPQSPTKSKNGHNESIHVVEVHCQHIVDACNRRGVYSGSLDLKTQLPHGPGSMLYPDGSKYAGAWRKGHWHGKGIHRDGKGGVYNGYFVQDKKEGTGILKYSSGKTFEGRFKDDQIREGTMTDARTGSTHEGLFENGRGHGFGSHHYSNGVRFHGQFEKGERHGHGVILLPDGGSYTGDFQNDLAHGKGQSVNCDGTVEHTGQWDEGHPVFSPKIYDA